MRGISILPVWIRMVLNPFEAVFEVQSDLQAQSDLT